MISVVIPTLNVEHHLARTLAALVPAALDGLVREVIVVDGGSDDGSLQVADDAGCTIVRAQRGRGTQLAAGAAVAKGEWLLFLHADTVLDEDWVEAAGRFICAAGHAGGQAAAFRFALDADGILPRLLEGAVRLRCAILALPYGDQGLLIPRSLYDELGGFSPIPLMEDVDLVRRIGRRRLHMLQARATTSAERYRRDGIIRRTLRNLVCLSLYYAGVSPDRIVRLYG